MRANKAWGVGAVFLLNTVACDLASQIAADHVIVATLTQVPPIDLSPAGVAGLDGGVPVDAGFLGDGGVVTLPSVTTTNAFFGRRPTTSPDSSPEAISDATATLASAGGKRNELKSLGAGNYGRSSVDDSAFVYEPGATYTFEFVAKGETYVAEVTDAPAAEKVSALHPASGLVKHKANTALTFSRPAPPEGKERNVAFVLVYPVSASGQKGEPTYNTMPKTPLDFLKLVAASGEWRQETVTVPGSAFPEANKTYVLLFQSAKTGGAKSKNVSAASAILAGTSDFAIVRTD